MKEIERFCIELYSTSYIEFDSNYLRNSDHIVAEQQDKIFMDRVLDIDEIRDAIKQMKSNSSPGSDGLVIEFYRDFQDKLIVLLYNTYQEAIINGKLHLTARRDIIFLIGKTGRDSLYLKNW